VLVIVLIIFGPKRLPELGRSMGQGIRGFKGAMSGEHDDDDDDSVEAKRQELEQAQSNLAAAEAKANQPAEGEVVTERKG
jgi:sec-independent protein translocase protein TatA